MEQPIDVALAAYLDLSSTLERVMDELETKLTKLAVASSARPKHVAEEQSRKVAELKGQLAHARKMMDGIRKDIARLNTTPRG